ncbi:MAG: cation-translocating P-type ATPase [Bacteroidetes bacterium]|nr:cation-translocating P-type ATPase [Bacteroidota bacterium]MBL0016442.1 cation-translocating P-type ATPase [Bacteroidota bacterium]MBP6639202.1 cation-translocating P-type ATPase [Bacteroidia bacterium]
MKKGLDSATVAAQLSKFGYNELATAAPKNVGRIALEVMKEPMFLLLISCGVLYMVLGDYKEGAIMLSTIFIIIGITFFQYRKTERALEALKNLSSPRALVLRDGAEIRIPGREVVPGDVMILQEGDRVPADATLLEATNFTVDESMLTGESLPVSKKLDATAEDKLNRVFSGTLVVHGRAVAEVGQTGPSTEFGKIGATLSKIEQVETRMQREMKVLIRVLAFIAIFLTIAVVLLFYFTRGNFLQSLLNGLSSAMAILPEEFPVVLTVFLALGAWRLSKKNVLTRNPSAIETLGSATVLCSDKTGTITQNQMAVAEVYADGVHIGKADFVAKIAQIQSLMHIAHAATPQDSIDPMDKAILVAHAAQFPETAPSPKALKEYALTHEQLVMSRAFAAVGETPSLVAAKGAPEAIAALCKLSPAEIAPIKEALLAMAAKGLRVIGVAEAAHPAGQALPETQSEFTFKFLGLIALEDPIRPEVPAAIALCNKAGIRVIMITGDYPETAKSIGAEIGLPADGLVLTGKELDELDEATLREKIKHTSIFARVVPEQKLRIVEALKANGEVVAMTGDGVNDAPALKAAHIGIAMGKKGTDVAREAASLVLLDDNFASIVSGMRLGRRIFDNLQKAMAFIIAIHIPIIGFTLIPAFLSTWPLLLLPLHIVFMELIIDPVCSIAFESENEEKGIMERPPRNKDEMFFGGKRIFQSAIKGLLLMGMVLGVYLFSRGEGHSEKEIRAITFSALIIGNIFLIVAQLSRTRSFIAVLAEGNKAVLLILISALALLLLIITVPGLQQIFAFEFPGFWHFWPSLGGSLALLMVLETWKLIKFKRMQSGK